MRRIGVGVTQAHALGERDERAEVVARDPFGERHVVPGHLVLDRGAVLGVGTRLLDLQPRERAAVGDAAEHRTLDVLGRLHRELPADPRAERVAGIAHGVEQVRVEHRDRSPTSASMPYAAASCGLSLAPCPSWSTPSTRNPARVRSRTHPVFTQLSRQLDANPCTHSTTGASSSPHRYVAMRRPSADITYCGDGISVRAGSAASMSAILPVGQGRDDGLSAAMNRVPPRTDPQGVHHGRSGRSPAPPRSSGLTASTWCSWIPPVSKASRDPAMYRPHTFAVGKPDLGDRLVPVLDEVGAPVAQRQRVVGTQVLLVQHLEADILRLGDDAARAGELAVGEDVAVDESAGRRLASCCRSG